MNSKPLFKALARINKWILPSLTKKRYFSNTENFYLKFAQGKLNYEIKLTLFEVPSYLLLKITQISNRHLKNVQSLVLMKLGSDIY